MRLREAGLIIYWRKQNFKEILAMDWVSLEDRNKRKCFQPLQLGDLQLALLPLHLLLVLSICYFILEIYWKKFGNMLTFRNKKNLLKNNLSSL